MQPCNDITSHDLEMLQYNLTLTHEQRLRQASDAAAAVEMLREAVSSANSQGKSFNAADETPRGARSHVQ